MKKVYLIKMITEYQTIILPKDIDTGEYCCFRSKSKLEKYIQLNAEYGDDKWKHCYPVAVPVFPKDNIAGEYMWIDKINYGIDYDFDAYSIYNKTQYSGVVYPSKDILKSKSGLYEYTMETINNMDENDKSGYVFEDDHIYSKYTETSFDSMSGHVDYRIYKLRIIK